MLSQHQRAIIEYIGESEKKKSQIVNRFQAWYYANESKHIGDVLSRMVNAGILERVKKGVFKRGKGGGIARSKLEIPNPNQTSLF